MTSRRRRLSQATVEYAIALPVFLLLTLCVVDLARAVWMYNTVAYVARDGARYGTVPGRTLADVESHVQSRCLTFIGGACTTSSPAPPAAPAADQATIGVTRGVCNDTTQPVVVTVKYVTSVITASLWTGSPGVPVEATAKMFVEACPGAAS